MLSIAHTTELLRDASHFPQPARRKIAKSARNIRLFEIRLAVQLIAQINTATLPYPSYLLCPCFCKGLIVLGNTTYVLMFLHIKIRWPICEQIFPRNKLVLDKIHPGKKKNRNGKKWLHSWTSLCNLAVFVASIFLGRTSQMVSVYFLYSLVLRESWPYFHFPTAWAFGLLQNSRKNFLQENNIWHPSSWLSEGAVY